MTARIPFPRNALVSYHYFKTYDLRQVDQFNLIADSGAFSAHRGGAVIDLDELCGWYQQWRSHFSWCATLDVIGDAGGTRRNWEMMRDRGVDTVPTVHFPAPPASVDYYASRGVTFLGLGGQVGRSAPARMRWAVSVMRYARDRWPELKFHGWGATDQGAQLLPYFSVDSSSWYSGKMWGDTVVFDPRDPLKAHKLLHDGTSVYTNPELCNLLSTVYGIDPASVCNTKASAGTENLWATIEVMARSAGVLETLLQARHGRIPRPKEVTGPEYGPLMHLVLPTEKTFIPRMNVELARDKAAA